jgi:hypothetical protein
MGQDYLTESLKTIRNLCDTAIFLQEHLLDRLLPTQLELIYSEAQQLIDDYCIMNENVSPPEQKTGTL